MIKLSSDDIKILELLQTDANQSTSDIANIMNMSQSPCWRRIKRLESEDIIERKVAIINKQKLGLDLVAFTTINLSEIGRKKMEVFESIVNQFDEVMECYTMTGAWDYMLKIVVRDIRQYEKFVRNKLLDIPMIGEIHSHLSVTEIKNTTELPLKTQMLS